MLLVTVLVGTGGCRVHMIWALTPGGASSCDGDGDVATREVYAVGSRIRVEAENPREHADVRSWSLELSPPGWADLEPTSSSEDTLRATLRVRQPGVGTIEVHRTHGFQADELSVEAATAVDVAARPRVDARAGSTETPSRLHLVDQLPVPLTVDDWRDGEGRWLRADDLLRVRADGVLRVARVGDDGLDLSAAGTGAGTLGVLALDDEVVTIPVQVHAKDEITDLWVEDGGTPVSLDTGGASPEPSSGTWLVAHVMIGGDRAYGAHLTWYQDDETIGHDEGVEVYDATGSTDDGSEPHVVTVCLGDPGPPVPPDTAVPPDTGEPRDSESPSDTDARDTEPGGGDDGHTDAADETDVTDPVADTDAAFDTDPVADTDPAADSDVADTDHFAQRPAPPRPPAHATSDALCAQVTLADGASIDPRDRPCGPISCRQGTAGGVGWVAAVVALALRRRRGVLRSRR